MADTDVTARAPRTYAPAQPDWADQAADTVERVVGTVRDKTTGPALTAARGLVYGLFAGLVGTAVLIMFTIGAVRVVDVYLPSSVFGETHTWAAHLVIGVVFVIAGAVLFGRRGRQVEQTTAARR